MVKVTVMGAVVTLIKVPDMLPVPDAGIPVTVAVLFLVQLYTVPATLPLFTMVTIGKLLHTGCAAGVATAFGVGLTVMVNVNGVPTQLVPPLV